MCWCYRGCCRAFFYSIFAHSLAGPGCPVDLAALSQELPEACKVRLTVCKTQVVGALRWCQAVEGEVASASMCTVTVFYMWVKCVHEYLPSSCVQVELMEDKRKGLEAEFHSATYNVLSELVTGLRTAAGYLYQVGSPLSIIWSDRVWVVLIVTGMHMVCVCPVVSAHVNRVCCFIVRCMQVESLHFFPSICVLMLLLRNA